MQIELVGLRYISRTTIEAHVYVTEKSDLLTYGLNYDYSTDDKRWHNELTAINNLIKVAIACGYNFVLMAYTKLYAAHTEADLLPELENITFDGDVFYLKVIRRD